jgi:hypothetical protein
MSVSATQFKMKAINEAISNGDAVQVYIRGIYCDAFTVQSVGDQHAYGVVFDTDRGTIFVDPADIAAVELLN